MSQKAQINDTVFFIYNDRVESLPVSSVENVSGQNVYTMLNQHGRPFCKEESFIELSLIDLKETLFPSVS